MGGRLSRKVEFNPWRLLLTNLLWNNLDCANPVQKRGARISIPEECPYL
jgi:hypothetical protein